MKEKIVKLRLTQSKEDGHWLHFEDSKGKQAGINIENTFPEPGIIGSCIRQWAIDQFEKPKKEETVHSKQEIIEWWKELLSYMEGKKKWDTGCIYVCESHPFLPMGHGYSFDCECGAPGMPPLNIITLQKTSE